MAISNTMKSVSLPFVTCRIVQYIPRSTRPIFRALPGGHFLFSCYVQLTFYRAFSDVRRNEDGDRCFTIAIYDVSNANIYIVMEMSSRLVFMMGFLQVFEYIVSCRPTEYNINTTYVLPLQHVLVHDWILHMPLLPLNSR